MRRFNDCAPPERPLVLKMNVNVCHVGVLRSSCRCSILSNATVKCDSGLYESLQAWKDHKLHIDHEVAHKTQQQQQPLETRVTIFTDSLYVWGWGEQNADRDAADENQELEGGQSSPEEGPPPGM